MTESVTWDIKEAAKLERVKEMFAQKKRQKKRIPTGKDGKYILPQFVPY